MNDYTTVTLGLLTDLQTTLTTWQAALVEAPPAALNDSAHGPGRPDPVWGIGGRRQQMQLALMQQLVSLLQSVATGADDTAALLEQMAAAHQALIALGQLGQGWFDERPVRRTVMIDGEAQQRLFGPYVYYRWLEGGKQRSLYLGHRSDWPQWPTKLARVGIAVRADTLAAALGIAASEESDITEDQRPIETP